MTSLFKNKNLNALVLSKNLVQYALQMRVLFFSWLAYEITQKDLWVGIILGVGSTPILLSSFLGGYLSERYNIKKILFYSNLIILFLFSLFFLIDFKNIYNLLILSFLFGIIMGVPGPPFWTIVINTFGKNNLSKINSFFYTFQFFGEMVIPLIFAFFIASLGSNYIISFACFIIIISTFLIYYFPEDKQVKNQKDKNIYDSFSKILREKPVVFWGTIIVSIQSIFGVTIFIVLPQYANNFGVGATGFGIFFAANGAGIFLGTIFSFYTGIFRSKLLIWVLSTVGWDVGQIIFAFSTNYYLSIIVLFLMGISAAYWIVAANLIFQNETSEKDRNKIMALYQFATQIFFIGWLVGGLISEITNAQIALVISGFSSYPIFIIAIISSKRLRVV
ncbi:MFS transporter [Chloroflexi bacterium]|nr:MFS transporter [Chloroflexota bacterium]